MKGQEIEIKFTIKEDENCFQAFGKEFVENNREAC